ncbi:MAG TPA: DNA polymerase III subunit gamma/tau [Anaerolineae bacterium]|nr:DNA polymerase III subunit gamma/tau [Anaerolineae bacterium]
MISLVSLRSAGERHDRDTWTISLEYAGGGVPVGKVEWIVTTQALYLKYRPQTFDEVVGQEPITRTLRNALRQGKLRHAYLFTGPRGTGKTTTARLLAKAVNCLAPEEERPCNACSLCQAVNEGRLLDLIEIDAASNRGIDEIRDIREKVGFRPNEGRYKVYVLDEAHMLTEPAFNALLKTLEEPPPHVIFCLVTTDPHKIPATITSRCQRFDFRRVSVEAIIGRLSYIAEQEGVTVEPAALELIARQSTGAMRDAISLLDQMTSYGDEITLDQVQMVLGAVSGEAAGKLANCLAQGDMAGGLDLINRTVGDGADPRQFAREVVEYLRGLLLVQQGAGTRLLHATAEQAAEMESLAQRMPTARLLRAIRLFNEAATDLRRGLQTIPQLALELALAQSVLEKGQRAAAAPAPVPPAPSRPQPAPPPSAARPAPPPEPRPTAEPPVGQVSNLSNISEGGPLTLAGVQARWSDFVESLNTRNKQTAAVFRSGCRPVEVVDDQVIVTVPSAILRDKVDHPRRKAEAQEVLTQVLGAACRLKLVLAAEYVPRQDPAPAPAAPPQGKAAAPDDEQVPDEISRWAAEHGAQVRIIH